MKISHLALCNIDFSSCYSSLSCICLRLNFLIQKSWDLLVAILLYWSWCDTRIVVATGQTSPWLKVDIVVAQYHFSRSTIKAKFNHGIRYSLWASTSFTQRRNSYMHSLCGRLYKTRKKGLFSYPHSWNIMQYFPHNFLLSQTLKMCTK